MLANLILIYVIIQIFINLFKMSNNLIEFVRSEAKINYLERGDTKCCSVCPLSHA